MKLWKLKLFRGCIHGTTVTVRIIFSFFIFPMLQHNIYIIQLFYFFKLAVESGIPSFKLEFVQSGWPWNLIRFSSNVFQGPYNWLRSTRFWDLRFSLTKLWFFFQVKCMCKPKFKNLWTNGGAKYSRHLKSCLKKKILLVRKCEKN